MIDKAYAKNLLNKMEVYKEQSRTSKQLFLKMITSAGLKPSAYLEEMVDGVVRLEDLFVQV